MNDERIGFRMRVEETIREKLRGAFAPAELEVVNDSHRHAGHHSSPGTGESHFSVTVVSAAFAGKSRLERHRMVNAALAEELAGPCTRLPSPRSRRRSGPRPHKLRRLCSARVSPCGRR